LRDNSRSDQLEALFVRIKENPGDHAKSQIGPSHANGGDTWRSTARYSQRSDQRKKDDDVENTHSEIRSGKDEKVDDENDTCAKEEGVGL